MKKKREGERERENQSDMVDENRKKKNAQKTDRGLKYILRANQRESQRLRNEKFIERELGSRKMGIRRAAYQLGKRARKKRRKKTRTFVLSCIVTVVSGVILRSKSG